MEASSYEPEKTARALRLRQGMFASEHLLSTSLADVVPILADGRDPKCAFYLPVRLDLEAISRNQKPSTAELSVDLPNAYLLISGNEQALTEQIMADIDYLRERTTAYAKSGFREDASHRGQEARQRDPALDAPAGKDRPVHRGPLAFMDVSGGGQYWTKHGRTAGEAGFRDL